MFNERGRRSRGGTGVRGCFKKTNRVWAGRGRGESCMSVLRETQTLKTTAGKTRHKTTMRSRPFVAGGVTGLESSRLVPGSTGPHSPPQLPLPPSAYCLQSHFIMQSCLYVFMEGGGKGTDTWTMCFAQ